MEERANEVLRISRLLTPENRGHLMSWVYVASAAENSVRKSALKTREYSRKNIVQRSKKCAKN